MLKQFLLMTAVLFLLAGTATSEDCVETVIIDSVEYSVGPRWCGKKLDSTQLAQPERLALIPAQFCFEDYRIYVDVTARDAFVSMAEAADKAGFLLMVDSGYRSARYQARIIAKYIKDGGRFADITRYVAPPGYSDHEAGRTVDMVPSDATFSRTDTYRWLKENAIEFGFVENSPKDTTGLMPWEPWHWTYQTVDED